MPQGIKKQQQQHIVERNRLAGVACIIAFEVNEKMWN